MAHIAKYTRLLVPEQPSAADICCDFRYNYLQYDDDVRAANDGVAHLLLAGVSARY